MADDKPVTPSGTRLRFDEAVADVVTDYRINRRKTLGAVERRMRMHLAPYFGHARMTDITTAHVRAFAAQRQQAGAANAEINR